MAYVIDLDNKYNNEKVNKSMINKIDIERNITNNVYMINEWQWP